MKVTQAMVSKIIRVNALFRKEFNRQFVEFGLCDDNDKGHLEVTLVKNGTVTYRSLPFDLLDKEVQEIFDHIVGVL